MCAPFHLVICSGGLHALSNRPLSLSVGVPSPWLKAHAQRPLPRPLAAYHRRNGSRRGEWPEGEYDEVITFLTPEGLIQLPGRPSSRPHGAPQRPRKPLQQTPLPSLDEQKLCIGSSFLVRANNGLDQQRMIIHSGWCQSIDLLLESIEDIVHVQGGNILEESRQLKRGLHEYLKLTVALPHLFGVPASLDHLRSAITVGGGFIERIQHRWDFK